MQLFGLIQAIRSDEGLTLETSALYSLRWPIYIFNLVDTTKLPCYPHRRSTTVSLETFTLNSGKTMVSILYQTHRGVCPCHGSKMKNQSLFLELTRQCGTDQTPREALNVR